MAKEFKAKLTIIKDSNAHKVLDDLKIPYRDQGRNIYVSMNNEQLENFNNTCNERISKFVKEVLGK